MRLESCDFLNEDDDIHGERGRGSRHVVYVNVEEYMYMIMGYSFIPKK